MGFRTHTWQVFTKICNLCQVNTAIKWLRWQNCFIWIYCVNAIFSCRKQLNIYNFTCLFTHTISWNLLKRATLTNYKLVYFNTCIFDLLPFSISQLVTLGAYVVASCFFSVYSMAVDTLFLCFCKYSHFILMKTQI